MGAVHKNASLYQQIQIYITPELQHSSVESKHKILQISDLKMEQIIITTVPTHLSFLNGLVTPLEV